jgi:hypothetical protein
MPPWTIASHIPAQQLPRQPCAVIGAKTTRINGGAIAALNYRHEKAGIKNKSLDLILFVAQNSRIRDHTTEL